jgi:arylsulfatase
MSGLRWFSSLAAVGSLVGLAGAVREVVRQGYVAQGLWRTALSMTGESTVRGMVVGAGLGAVLALLVWAWVRAMATSRAPQVQVRLLSHRFTRFVARIIAGRFGLALSVVVLAGGVALWGVGIIAVGQARAEARERGVNVILIGVDTLRADRASLITADEYERDLTPNLRRLLAARGTVFTNAITQAPWTLPAFASIFTGLYPEQHGAEHLTSTLRRSQLTIAEILREAGYSTLGVVSCEYLNAASGMGQGFDVLDESQVLGHQAITSEEVTTRALSLLEDRRGEPFFLFVHYFDPHFNYRDHAGYHFADEYVGRLRGPVQTVDQNMFRWMIRALGPDYRGGSPRMAEADRGYLSDAYDEEVAYTDAQIGRLLAYLEEAQLWDSTVVIAVGDHGEELVDRNWLGHAITLYQELIHVPLVIAAPQMAGPFRDARLVEVRALFATILDFAGVANDGNGSRESLLADQSRKRVLARSSTRPRMAAVSSSRIT